MNPTRIALAAVRRLVPAVTIRGRFLIKAGVVLAAILIPATFIYTVTVPVSYARQLAAAMGGGAPDLPESKRACLQSSAALTAAGTYTEPAAAAVSQIPPGATITRASAWLLYKFSHPQDPWPTDWAEWITKIKDRGIADTADDTEIALTIDPQTDYSSHLPAARATTIGLAINGAVTATKRQVTDLAEKIYRQCSQQATQQPTENKEGDQQP